MNSKDKLSRDYFELIRDALKEQKKNDIAEEDAMTLKRPLKRRKKVTQKEEDKLPNVGSELPGKYKKGIDYKTLIDLTANDVGEASAVKEKRKATLERPLRRTPAKKVEVVNLDSDLSAEDTQNGNYVFDSDENYSLEYTVDPTDFSSEEYSDDDFEDVDIEGAARNTAENDNSDFTFRINDTSKATKNKRNVISKELKQERMNYYRCYIALNLLTVGLKNTWCNNKKLQSRLDPLLPSRIFNSLHPPKDIKLPVKSTNKLIHGLKEAIVFWSNYFTIDENLDIGFYMRKWNELRTAPLYKVHDYMTETSFLDTILNKKVGSKETCLLGFVALLRSVGLNCRLVYNMQPPDISDIGRQPKRELSRYDYNDLMECESFKFPLFWCEVWDKYTKKWLTCDPAVFKTVERHVSNANTVSKLCPRISKEEQRLVTRFVVAFNKNNQLRDVTPRYTNKYFNKVFMKRFRNDETLEIWYNNYLKLLGEKLGSGKTKKDSKLKIDEYEDKFMEEKLSIESFPESIKDFQNHPKFVLQSKIPKTLFYLYPDTKPVGFFKNEKVFLRSDLHKLKSKHKWLQEGRVVKELEKPKHLAKSFTGSEKKEKELFVYEQTEDYVPHSALSNGKIITNKFGNVEVYHPSMIPLNCLLIDHPLVIKAADFLKIEYAKAVVGWDYKNKGGAAGKASRSAATGRKSASSATAKYGGIVCLRDYRDALVAMIEEMEQLAREQKLMDREKVFMNEWVNLFKRLTINERLDGELNRSGWLAADGAPQNDSAGSEESENGGGFVPEENENGGGFVPEENQIVAGENDEVSDDVSENMSESGGFIVEEPAAPRDGGQKSADAPRDHAAPSSHEPSDAETNSGMDFAQFMGIMDEY